MLVPLLGGALLAGALLGGGTLGPLAARAGGTTRTLPLATLDLEDPLTAPLSALTEVPAGDPRLPKRAQVVAVAEAGRKRRRWMFPVLGTWYSAPATLFRAVVDGTALDVLDADEDGDPSGAADRVRWAGGAFRAPPASGRLASHDGIVAFRIERASSGWVVHVTPETRPAEVSEAEWAGLLAVGGYRNLVGLGPLRLDRARCAGCAKHAEYARLNPADGFGHEEVEGRPGFSREGREAAALGVMERTAHPRLAVEDLARTALHRMPLLGRDEGPLGVGCAGLYVGPWQDAWDSGVTVLWADVPLGMTQFPVLVPAPGARDVPREARGEQPAPEGRAAFYAVPRGYPVSVGFLGAGRRLATLRVFALEKRAARPVEGVLFTPERPVHPSFAHNFATAFLVPNAPLERRTTYAVEAVVEGAEPRTLRWTFRSAAE